MALRTYRWALVLTLIAPLSPHVRAQVFVVGEKTATADIKTDFTPTHVDIPDARLDERGRRQLVRDLEAEQGFAHRAIPMGGAGVTLRANGPLTPGPDQYRKMIFDKGQAAAPGDRVLITALQFKPDRIIIDINGGPYAKHRFLSHVSINDNPVVNTNPDERPTGARIFLVFEGGIPEVSGPEVKALLEPLIDFGVKSSDQAYADTLPAPLKNAIAAHDVLVGMTHRMVLAALGPPESKMRDQPSGDPNGARYEEWIYGHVPQTVKFVRFVGDRVSMVEIAAMGKPIEIHDKDEMAGYEDPSLTHEVALGDRTADVSQTGAAPAPPSLHRPDDPVDPDVPLNAKNKVQFPDDPKPTDVKVGSSKPDDSGDAKPADTPRAKPSLGPAPSGDPSQFVSQVR
jgi:hypothetical protein